MMETKKILTEKSRATQVEAVAVSENYEYQVGYTFTGASLVRLQCNITEIAEVESVEQRTYGGYMSLDNGNKSMNFPANVDAAKHIVVFENIIKEVCTGLSA